MFFCYETIATAISNSFVNTGMASTTDQIKSTSARSYQLPLTKVKSIIKLDNNTRMISHDSVYLLTLATEEFIRMLTRDAHSSMKQCASKRLDRLHIFSSINTNPLYEFLDGSFD
ncbi:unnamed protein product [Rotaria magnacalcarata]|uniref:Transcription factor CBF/NF-Y/archaeal histone domain-containing protein n=2 Tax=Rotaria magnacalcarata TaxID=392030 RepID=A0A815E4P0_9BILA|nr:unnamed protein product [Rotaria magnacalcarata]